MILVLNFVTSIINLCTWVTFGWPFSCGLNGDHEKSETDYEASAHLVDILLYSHYCVADPNGNIFDTNVFPFPTIGKKTSAKQLIIMKLDHFHIFA